MFAGRKLEQKVDTSAASDFGRYQGTSLTVPTAPVMLITMHRLHQPELDPNVQEAFHLFSSQPVSELGSSVPL
jgi:hypothetical protein